MAEAVWIKGKICLASKANILRVSSYCVFLAGREPEKRPARVLRANLPRPRPAHLQIPVLTSSPKTGSRGFHDRETRDRVQIALIPDRVVFTDREILKTREFPLTRPMNS